MSAGGTVNTAARMLASVQARDVVRQVDDVFLRQRLYQAAHDAAVVGALDVGAVVATAVQNISGS